MKLKLLLLFCLLIPGVLFAQDTIRYFIITEVRMDRNDQSYVELTNVGTEPIHMNQFELGRVGAWTQPYEPLPGEYMMLPDSILAPGESYVIASVLDFTEEMYPLQPDFFNERITKKEWWTLADMQLHVQEARGGPGTSDSISPNRLILETWSGRECIYIEQHLSESDSVVIDQVGGIFAQDDGTNEDAGMFDVAGVVGATGNSVLVRKANIKQGNTDFDKARGVDIADSEWIPIPLLYGNWEPYRAVFWTVGNHGNFTLDENTLVSDVLDVDWANKTITAPWGVRNNDDFMRLFDKKPGIAWHYDLSPAREDSAFNSARTGDKLTVYVCGNTLETATFEIVVAEPTQDANIVVPKFVIDREYDEETNTVNAFYTNDINSGSDEPYEVTVNAPGMDTITNSLFGVPYATRTDSLLKYLEKPSNANWEFVWVDGVERPDLKTGDILKVTSESGKEKEYFIKVAGYRPSHIAYLSSITWPDIPENLKGLFGWTGDTIPGFGSTVFNYKVSVPSNTESVPALLAKTQQLNASVDVKRAISLNGTTEQKTIDFTVTAEDDTTTNVYSVQLEKEKDFTDVQPFEAEPFLSELVFQDQWANGFIEICNPGNQPLDLSNYMLVFTYNDKAGAITDYSGEDQWNVRYRKYVPGYKWVDEGEWAINPGRLEQDLNVSPIVMPGDVFVAGHLTGVGTSGYPWWASEQCDVILNSPYNPWNETYDQWASAVHEWMGGNFYLFKILNDSIKLGLKPANDLYDFELIEVFGMGDGSNWMVGGVQVEQITNYMRKPQYWQGKTGYAESFGTNLEDCEWTWTNRPYWDARNIPWPQDILYVTNDLGKHFMNEVTLYKSTVTSSVYKVSEGYSWDEEIRGPRTGTTVAELMSNVIKADENQTLKVVSVADEAELTMDALLSMNDTLVVISADSTNITKYRLDVTEEGLSPNAILTSDKYEVEITQQPSVVGETKSTAEMGIGAIRGFEYGTQLKTVLNNVHVPAGATLTVINSEGAYVPQTMLNYDTSYVFVTVNPNIYFEVLAEDGLTAITYQLQPQVSENTAFLTSDVYSVDQRDLLIQYVPRGTAVDAFLSNVVPSLGASIMIVDKFGLQRTDGQLYQDDRAVVTAEGGAQTMYYLSMLSTHIVPATTYLAYVTSNVYTVDQMDMTIEGGLTGSTDVAEFYSRIKPAIGATAVIVDLSGNDKVSGDLDQGDMLKVTSADGHAQVMYQILFSTSVKTYDAAQITIYPNPTNGTVNVSGVDSGDWIQVYNSTGALICNSHVLRNIETISLENQPSGIYLIIVSNQNKTLGQFKILKE